MQIVEFEEVESGQVPGYISVLSESEGNVLVLGFCFRTVKTIAEELKSLLKTREVYFSHKKGYVELIISTKKCNIRFRPIKNDKDINGDIIILVGSDMMEKSVVDSVYDALSVEDLESKDDKSNKA